MARVIHVKKAQKDNPKAGIKKGEPYYWWKFRRGGKHYSKTPPRQSQLTQSEFLSQLYGLEEQLDGYQPGGFDTVADLESDIQSIIEDLENLKSETEDKLGNMPEGLQQGDTGQLLQERIDGVDNLVSELEALDFDEPNYEDFLAEAETDLTQEEDEEEDAFQERVTAKAHELAAAAVEAKVSELLDEAKGAGWSIS